MERTGQAHIELSGILRGKMPGRFRNDLSQLQARLASSIMAIASSTVPPGSGIQEVRGFLPRSHLLLPDIKRPDRDRIGAPAVRTLSHVPLEEILADLLAIQGAEYSHSPIWIMIVIIYITSIQSTDRLFPPGEPCLITYPPCGVSIINAGWLRIYTMRSTQSGCVREDAIGTLLTEIMSKLSHQASGQAKEVY